jgi:hypothetical protein
MSFVYIAKPHCTNRDLGAATAAQSAVAAAAAAAAEAMPFVYIA